MMFYLIIINFCNLLITRCHPSITSYVSSIYEEGNYPVNKITDTYKINFHDTIPTRISFLNLVGKSIDDLESIENNKYKITVQHTDSLFEISTLTNLSNLIVEAIIFYHSKDNIIYKIVDLWTYNPYLGYFDPNDIAANEQGLIGYNELVNGDKSKINFNVPNLLLESIPLNWKIYSIQNSIYLTINDKGPIIVSYGINALPPDEVLEHITYPGLSSFLVLDRNTGHPISRIVDIPYVVTSWANDELGQYLGFTHLSNMIKDTISLKMDKWKYTEIINLHSGSICFKLSSISDCDCSYYNKANHMIFTCYDSMEQVEGKAPLRIYHLINSELYFRDTEKNETYSFTTSEAYEWTKKESGLIKLYYYPKDYTPIKLNCE